MKHYIKLKELPINTTKKIKINTELYRLTGNTEYLDEVKRDILTLLLNLPDNLKKTFVNKPGIKKILKA